MNKNIIIKSLLNGILTFVVVALVQYLVEGVALTQAIAAPYTIFLAISAIVGSFIGFSIKAAKE